MTLNRISLFPTLYTAVDSLRGESPDTMFGRSHRENLEIFSLSTARTTNQASGWSEDMGFSPRDLIPVIVLGSHLVFKNLHCVNIQINVTSCERGPWSRMDGKQRNPVFTGIWALSKDYGALTGTKKAFLLSSAEIIAYQYESRGG